MNTKFETYLPPGWEPGYDQNLSRWFFVHRTSGYSQYLLPKPGDEVSKAAEWVPKCPSSVTTNSEGLFVVQNQKLQAATTTVEVQNIHSRPPTPEGLISGISRTTQPVPQLRSSGAVARKPVRKSVAAPSEQVFLRGLISGKTLLTKLLGPKFTAERE